MDDLMLGVIACGGIFSFGMGIVGIVFLVRHRLKVWWLVNCAKDTLIVSYRNAECKVHAVGYQGEKLWVVPLDKTDGQWVSSSEIRIVRQ